MDRLGVTVQSVAPIRNALIKEGMIYSPAHGDTAFTVPLLGDFMKRIMPAVVKPSRTYSQRRFSSRNDSLPRGRWRVP